jgi:hypothetical protein
MMLPVPNGLRALINRNEDFARARAVERDLGHFQRLAGGKGDRGADLHVHLTFSQLSRGR